MPKKTFTFKKKDGSKVGIEAESIAAAQKIAKDKYGIGSKPDPRNKDEEE